MAFTSTAVSIGGIAAIVLFAAGVVTLLVTRNSPDRKKWGWLLLALGACALVSAIVNLIGKT